MWYKNDIDAFALAYERSAPKIPDETCPLIDSVVEVIKSLPKNEELLATLEVIRDSNAELRELGRYWHKGFDEVAEKANDIVADLRKENDELEEEISRLKDENDALAKQE